MSPRGKIRAPCRHSGGDTRVNLVNHRRMSPGGWPAMPHAPQKLSPGNALTAFLVMRRAVLFAVLLGVGSFSPAQQPSAPREVTLAEVHALIVKGDPSPVSVTCTVLF